jgi:hypothetical protein
MITKKESTMEFPSTEIIRLLHTRIIQNFHLICLDKNIDEMNDDECQSFVINLRQVVNTINIFNDSDAFIDFYRGCQ